MNTNPNVRVIRAFAGFRVGHTFCPNGVYRDRLLRAGYIEIIKPSDMKPEVQAEVQLPRASRGRKRGVATA